MRQDGTKAERKDFYEWIGFGVLSWESLTKVKLLYAKKNFLFAKKKKKT